MPFNHFDSQVRTNDFWSFPVERINEHLERNHHKDLLQRTGVSAVVGAPLPTEILENITILKNGFERTMKAFKSTAKVEWRKEMNALHFSVYSLTTPDHYHPETSWPMHEQQLEAIKAAVKQFAGFELQLQGLGILGMGAVSIRVSDSPELEKLRDALAAIENVSPERFGSRTKKIIIGRIIPPITREDRDAIQQACKAFEGFTIGTLKVDAIDVVHYKNTFLDAEHERIKFTKS